MVRLLDL